MATRPNRILRTLLIACILVFLFSSTALADTYPSPTGVFYVNDFAGVLDTQAEQYIEATAAAVEQLTTAQIVVVTVDGLDDAVLEEYSLGLFREWGIGSQQADNGVLLLVDIGGRQSRVEVGYGLEGALPDGKTGRIQDDFMVPNFQQENYGLGILQGFNAIANEIYIEYGYEDEVIGDYTPIADPRSTTGQETPSIFRIIGIIVVIILIILDFKLTGGIFTLTLLRMLGRGGSRGGGSGGSRRSGGGGGSAGGGGSSRRW